MSTWSERIDGLSLRRRRGQSTIELCLALTAGIFALVAIWPLIRDAVAGQWKAVADGISQGAQFEELGGVTIVQQCTSVDPATGDCTAWAP